ncbi:MAG: nucleotidyltransferase [Chloroflexi bacterium]|nr:nucleotidyltransferase [Chloroflexota bacterium]
MPIPETQLETWAYQGSTATASHVYHAITNALKNPMSSLDGRDFEVYLQGSYRNDTNILPDSDVDVVLQLNETFEFDISRLTPQQQYSYRQNTHPVQYSFPDFKRDVISALIATFGTRAVKQGNKSIKVTVANSSVPCDIVPCLQFRRFLQPHYYFPPQYATGIVFYSSDGRNRIVSYPIIHYDNGVAKNGRTNGRFKPTVRMFKGARNFLTETNRLPPQIAPSHCIECLAYNAPDQYFTGNYEETFCNIVNWALKVDPQSLTTQDGYYYLIGESEQQWRLQAEQQYISSLVKLWNNW